MVVSLLWCTLAGVLLGIAQPLYMPLLFGDVSALQNYLGLFALVGYVPFFCVLAKQSLKSCFWLTAYTWTVQFSISLYWIYVALHVHGHIAPVPSALITIVLPFVLGLLATSFFVIARLLSLRFSRSFLWFAPLALCSAEYFRNYYIFGGFPWANAGYAVGRIDELLQSASLIGVYGLVFFVGVINSLFAWAVLVRTKKALALGCSIAVGIVLIAYGFGAARLSRYGNEFAPTLRVALLQGDIPQDMKSQARMHTKEIFEIYQKLHRQAIAEQAELVVWPESSYPWAVDEDVKRLRLSEQDEVASVIGATAFARTDDEKGYRARNAALFLDYDGRVVKRYDKSHLVPFGEYVPWPMSGVVDKVVPGMGAFVPGTEFTPVNLRLSAANRLPIGATVCYEGIFPEITRAYAKNGAALLVNLTNDAWYGRTSAPYQHLLMYKMRSAESGLSYVRATNSGISGWVDPFGRLHQPSELFKRDVIIADVPLLTKKTVYVMIGDVIPITAILLLLGGFLWAVLPLRAIWIARAYNKMALIFGLLVISLVSHWYFSQEQFLTDESARTKNLGILLLCLLVLVGALNRSKRTRAVLMAVGLLLLSCSLLLVIFESWYFSFGIIVGLLIYLMAFRMKEPNPVP